MQRCIWKSLKDLASRLSWKLLAIPLLFEIACRPAHGCAVGPYQDVKVDQSINALLIYIEGSFGAVFMLASLLASICCLTFGTAKKRKVWLTAALAFLLLAIGLFVLRSMVGTFFNDSCIAA